MILSGKKGKEMFKKKVKKVVLVTFLHAYGPLDSRGPDGTS